MWESLRWVTSHCDPGNQSGRSEMGGREGKLKRRLKYERISICGEFILLFLFKGLFSD